jgi:membrane associated rhomboid family serine protease
MIPLGDATRKTRRFPIATLLIITANAVVFFLELQNGDAFIQRWSLVPAQVAAGRDLVTVLTAMFMHAGWIHILGNMLFFWVFSPPIEEVMGPVRFLVFYLLAGLAATFAQVAVAPASTVPNLGASGAIAGVMGAFLVTYPRDRIRTLLILGIFIDIEFIPAILLVGIWFAIQLFSGLASVSQVQTGGVAYMAHVGGFVFGLITNRFFEVSRPQRGLRTTE